MANYTFLDATGATKTAASSTIGGVEYPVVKVPDVVQVIGSIQQYGTTSVSGIVNINSVIGTYAEDSQHVTADKGFFVMGVRNDTLSSITSSDGDYSPQVVGPMGETIVANAPITKWVQGTGSLISSPIGSVPVLLAPGTSIFTYITGFQATTFSNPSVLLGLYGGNNSILGFAVPNIPQVYPNGLRLEANRAFSVSIIAGVQSSIYLSAQGFISKT